MAIDTLKLMLSFMREINDGNTPTAEDYELTLESYYNMIEACQDEGLIKGAIPVKSLSCPYTEYVTNRVRLTVKGIEYLHQNSAIMKTYKGLKEIREWLPF